MANIKYVAMTTADYFDMLVAQNDPVKWDKLRHEVDHPRASGDKLYIKAYLIDGLRLPPYYPVIAPLEV